MTVTDTGTMRNGRIWHVLLWRDARKSGIAFASGLILLVALSYYSVLVVLTCVTIPLVTMTLLLRAMYAAKCAILKTPMEHPFQCKVFLFAKGSILQTPFDSNSNAVLATCQHWLDEGWEIRGDKMDSINKRVADTVNMIVLEMKRLVLVSDFADSVKFLWALFTIYYIGKNVSGITLLFLGFLGAFSIPKIYDMYRKDIDQILKTLHTKYEDFYQRILASIPGISKNSTSTKKSAHASTVSSDEVSSSNNNNMKDKES